MFCRLAVSVSLVDSDPVNEFCVTSQVEFNANRFVWGYMTGRTVKFEIFGTEQVDVEAR